MLPDDQPEVDPALADAVRDTLVHPVDPATARRHLSAMVAAAEAGAQPAARRWRPRRPMWRTGLAAGAATLLLPAGLSFAGVPLPAIVEWPYHAIGFDLPKSPPEATPRSPDAPATVPGSGSTATPTAAPSIERERPRAGERSAGDRRADRREAGREKRRADGIQMDGRRHDSRATGEMRAPKGGVAEPEADHPGATFGLPPGAGDQKARRTRPHPGPTRPGHAVPAPVSTPGRASAPRGERPSPVTEGPAVKEKSREPRGAPVGDQPSAGAGGAATPHSRSG